MYQLLHWLAIFLFFFLCALAAASSRAAFILRSQFPSVWEAEGRPVRWLYLNRMPPKNHFFTFLDQRRYLATGSASYSRLCSAIRVGWYLFFLLFAGVFTSMLIAIFSGNHA
jgi:hypothetical protein